MFHEMIFLLQVGLGVGNKKVLLIQSLMVGTDGKGEAGMFVAGSRSNTGFMSTGL